jgi:hypothetical protein
VATINASATLTISVAPRASTTVTLDSPYDLRIGSLRFPTVFDDLKEAVGDSLEAVGSGIAPGGRRARPFNFSLPVHGMQDDWPNGFEAGERIRRQTRAFMNNPAARLQGNYLSFKADSEMNCFVLLGAGDLEYVNGGISTAEFRLSLSDTYVVGNLRTHIPGRRFEVYDRTAATYPRDFYGLYYSSDYATKTGTAIGVLPPGDHLGQAVPVVYSGRVPVASLDYDTTLFGPEPRLTVTDRSVYGVELGELALRSGGVKIFDRRNNFSPTQTVAGDADPGPNYLWEQVYGPDQPLTADVPVIENLNCRVSWDRAKECLVISRASAPTFFGGTYAEYCRVAAFYDATNKVGFPYHKARVLSWTTEEGVLLIEGDGGARLIVTLRRGMVGPRIEYYNYSAGVYTAALRVVPTVSGVQEFSTGVVGSATTNDPADGAYTATFIGTGGSTSSPYAKIRATASNNEIVASLILAQSTTITSKDDSNLVGAARKSMHIQSNLGATPGYQQIKIGTYVAGSATPTAAEQWAENLRDVYPVPELIARS